MCLPSPAKVLRNVKRMTKFIEKKALKISRNKPVKPVPTLSTTTLPSFSTSSKYLNLSVVKNTEVNIKPRKIYHPTTINACLTMFNNHPDALTQEEIIKFNHYKSWKRESGDPLENNPIYLPTGGLRKFLVCQNLI